MDLANALQSLMALFVEQFSGLSADITACIKSKGTGWISSQAAFIQALFKISAGKVELIKSTKNVKKSAFDAKHLEKKLF